MTTALPSLNVEESALILCGLLRIDRHGPQGRLVYAQLLCVALDQHEADCAEARRLLAGELSPLRLEVLALPVACRPVDDRERGVPLRQSRQRRYSPRRAEARAEGSG